MERLALAVLAGVMAGLWVSASGELLLFLLVLTLLTLMRGRCPLMLAGLLTGWCWAALQAHQYRAQLPGDELRDADLLVTGCVVNFPRHDSGGTSFLFRGTQADTGFGLMHLRLYKPRQPQLVDNPLMPQAAQCYDLMLRLKPPHGQSNPGQFDRQRWLMAQRVRAVGYVQDSRLNRQRTGLQVTDDVLRLRAVISDGIRSALPDHPAAAVIEGLTVGVRSGISQAAWDVFRATGTVHLMAISGLHVGLVAGGVWWAVARLSNRLCAPGRLHWPAAASGSLAALGYALLAGWSAPTQRAAMMFTILLLIVARYRLSRPGGLLAASMLAVLFADPFVLLQPGFWMSFLAVALLMSMPALSSEASSLECISSRRVRACGEKFRRAVYAVSTAQWRLTLGLTVPNMLLFDAWPILSPLINLLAIPLFSFLLLPLTLFAVALLWLWPTAGNLLIGVAADMLGQAADLLRLAAAQPWADPAFVGSRQSLQIWLGTITLLWLLPQPLRSRRLLLFAPALFAVSALLLPRPAFQVDVLDVGQGTAVMIRTAQRTLLVDTGPAWPGGDAGNTVILPYLRNAGVSELDAIVVSHADNDHRGGLNTLLAAIPVMAVFVPEPHGSSQHWRCRRGMHWKWGETEVQFLHPVTVAGWSKNNASCVLLVRYRGASVLLPGDIETAAEAVLTARYPDLRSDVVIAPHHGSSTSSGERFVMGVQPAYAVYTTAYWNRWGFPKPRVVSRWRAVGACGLNLPLTGALRFEWREGMGLQLVNARKSHWTRPRAIRPESDDYCL